MATFASGNGGYIEVIPEGAATQTRIDVGKWTIRRTARLAENTHSGVSSTNFERVVYHYETTIEIPIDVDDPPENYMTEGDKVTLFLQRGESALFHTITNTSVETMEEVDDNSQDILRMAVSTKGGSLS